jgi:hypothetical protein
MARSRNYSFRTRGLSLLKVSICRDLILPTIAGLECARSELGGAAPLPRTLASYPYDRRYASCSNAVQPGCRIAWGPREPTSLFLRSELIQVHHYAAVVLTDSKYTRLGGSTWIRSHVAVAASPYLLASQRRSDRLLGPNRWTRHTGRNPFGTPQQTGPAGTPADQFLRKWLSILSRTSHAPPRGRTHSEVYGSPASARRTLA